jgi:hypothetical protein
MLTDRPTAQDLDSQRRIEAGKAALTAGLHTAVDRWVEGLFTDVLAALLLPPEGPVPVEKVVT